MNKIIGAFILLHFCIVANGQAGGVQAITNYSIAQKRLLVVSICEFANFITQNNLDEDSVMNLARKIAGIPFLLPYNENFPGERISPATNFVNTGRIYDAKKAVNLASGDMRLQGLLEISLWYLHRDGNHRKDLDSASRFIQLALKENLSAGSGRWENECKLQSAELQFQKGNIEQSRTIFDQLTSPAIQQGEDAVAAQAYMRMADLLSPTDTSKLNLYNRSLNIYRALGLKEKQIVLLWKLTVLNVDGDIASAEKNTREIIKISENTGFEHKMFAQNFLSYILINRNDLLGGLEYARVALENLKWSGLPDVQGAFYIRLGACYACLGKINESIQWFNKALATGTQQNHLFWYKSILILGAIFCFEINDPSATLSMVDSVTNKFPPLTVWENLQLLSLVGISYELLKKPKLADKYFGRLLQLAKTNKIADPYGEMSGDYIMISQFYVARQNLPMARRFLKQAMEKDRKDATSLSLKYSLYYKMDSLEGKYKSALQNHIKYKLYYDSSFSMDQRKKMDELTVRYAAEKKDQDIKLLKQEGISRELELRQNKLTRDLMIAGTVLLLIILGLLFSRFRLKQRSNAAMNIKNLALQRLLDEKEWLLKEVHHRVKNNLHTITSLLESQAAYLKDDSLKAIENAQHRIFAMSLIHQKLYQDENLKTIDMSVYLPEFIGYLKDSFETHRQIYFELDIEIFNLSVTQAIPIALIINEAVTNAIKYAFPGNRKGNIQIMLYKDSDHINLVIVDNGIGINKSLIDRAAGSMGLKLIKGLSEDINGRMEITGENGTRIHINFPADPLLGYQAENPSIAQDVYA